MWEDGVNRGRFGTTSAAGDLFARVVDGGVVRYSRNGSVFYTSLVAPRYPLLVDASLAGVGSQLKDAVLAGVLEPVAVSAPELSVPSGTYEAAQSVEVTVAPIEARIHYTTNGADPTEADPWVSSGGVVLVSESQTLKVKAYLAGLLPSPVVTARYTIGGTVTRSRWCGRTW